MESFKSPQLTKRPEKEERGGVAEQAMVFMTKFTALGSITTSRVKRRMAN